MHGILLLIFIVLLILFLILVFLVILLFCWAMVFTRPSKIDSSLGGFHRSEGGIQYSPLNTARRERKGVNFLGKLSRSVVGRWARG